jgi:hypothetical protein
MEHPCATGSGLGRSRRAPVLATSIVALTLALATAGCGSSTSTTSTQADHTATTSQQSPFIAQANAICRQLNAEFDAHKPASTSVREIARLSPPRAALEAKTLEELSKLTPSASLASDWQQILRYRQTLARELAQLGHEAKANNVTAINALATSKKHVHEKLHTVATGAGINECGEIG